MVSPSDSGLVMLDEVLTPSLQGSSCPHLAVLLRTSHELYPVLASFYALGAKRGGWLAHRSIRGEADDDREQLAGCGLDARQLEAEERMSVVEFDPEEAPDQSTAPWERALDEALERGHKALWYSRFAVGPDEETFAAVLPFERAWEQRFKGRPVVTLCPYIVGELDGAATLDRLADVSALHEGVLVSGRDGFRLLGEAS